MNLHWINPHQKDAAFPDPEKALQEPNGLLAIGGDLSEARLLNAYRNGIFPWYNPEEPILWWSPDPRTVFEFDRLHVSRSLQRALRREDYRVTLDQDFASVIRACGAPRKGQPGTWLSDDMIDAYCALHQAGHAHSIEVWREEKLIGGLYGIALGGCFFGESMFSRASNGSKIALVWLCRQLQAWDFDFLDGQVSSPHLQRMGASIWPRRQFLERLKLATEKPGRIGRWSLEIDHAAAGRRFATENSGKANVTA